MGALTSLALLLALLMVAPPAVAALRKTVQPEYTLLRRTPGSYVIGTAYRGWTVDVQQDALRGYRWGRVYGSINDCVWIFEGAVPPGGSTVPDSCRHTGREVTGFTNGQIGDNGTGTDGATAHINTRNAGCVHQSGGQALAYGNVKPWLSVAEPSDVLFGRPDGKYVRWRYVSRDGNWVMVHDTEFDPNDGVGPQNWFFVQRACIDLF